MATYFVSRTGNGSAPTTDPGTSGSWTGAYATFAAALAAATSDGDIIKVSDEHYEAFSADTTFTFQNNVSVICVDHADTSVQSAMDGTNGYLKATSGNSSVNILGAYKVYIYGIYFGANASDTLGIAAGASSVDGCDYVLDTCTLALLNGTGSGNYIRVGGGANSTNSVVTLIKPTIVFSHAGQYIAAAAKMEILGGSISGTAPTELFKNALSDPGGGYVSAIGCDLSLCTGTLVGSCAFSSIEFVFAQCKLGSGVAWFTASPTPANGSNAHVTILDCDSGDNHYQFGFQNAFGTLSIDTGIYANDGAEYNSAGTKHSWKIVTTANASFQHPFKTPLISVHNEATGAITPSLEIVRSGSATAYKDNEVWAQFFYKGTSGFTLATLDNSDRMTDLGSAANQATGALDASGWTGENATSWFGKLAPASAITPAEIGDISARVCVGAASATVYIDPQIRGLS